MVSHYLLQVCIKLLASGQALPVKITVGHREQYIHYWKTNSQVQKYFVKLCRGCCRFPIRDIQSSKEVIRMNINIIKALTKQRVMYFQNFSSLQNHPFYLSTNCFFPKPKEKLCSYASCTKKRDMQQ